MSRLRVLHITPIFPSKSNPGKGTFIKSQIDSLHKFVDIELLVLPGNRGVIPYLLEIPRIKQRIKEDYDIIHVHFGHVSTLVKLIYKGNTPLITSYLGSDLLGIKSKSIFKALMGKLFTGLNRRYSRYDTHAIVKTAEMAELLAPHAKEISVIPNGVDTDMFNVSDRLEAKEKLNLPKNKMVILFPADTCLMVKNFDLLRNALKEVDMKNYHLVTFERGNIPYTMVPTYLRAADLVVCTSHHEGSPNIIKEAMACNCTIFSTDCGDVKWLLKGVLDGRILPPTKTAWTEAINDLIERGYAGVSNAREVLNEKDLGIEKVAERIMAIYTQATEKNK